MFGVLFCTWVLTAVVGLGISAVSTLYLVIPQGVPDEVGGTPVRPPKTSTSAAALAAGVLMIVWPLPFCRRSPPSEEVDGFGRGA